MRRYLDAGLDSARLEALQTLGFQSRGSVSAPHQHDLDSQMPAPINVRVGRTRTAGRGVRGRRAIDFQFVIPPTASASVISPFRGINRAVFRAVELVAPVGRPRDRARRWRRAALGLRPLWGLAEDCRHKKECEIVSPYSKNKTGGPGCGAVSFRDVTLDGADDGQSCKGTDHGEELLPIPFFLGGHRRSGRRTCRHRSRRLLQTQSGESLQLFSEKT